MNIYTYIYIYICIYISGMYRDRNGTETNEESWNGPVFLERNGQQQETYPLNPERLVIAERQDRNGWNGWNRCGTAGTAGPERWRNPGTGEPMELNKNTVLRTGRTGLCNL